MSPWHKVTTLAERYDLSLYYMHDDALPADAPRPMPTCYWPKENIEFLQRYRDWMLSGGVSEMVTNVYHIMMAGHVFGLTLKPYHQLDPDTDLDCALEYVKSKGMSPSWVKNCDHSLKHFRRFLRLQRGLGDESNITPFDVQKHTQGLPEWVVSELNRYQKIQQRNWRTARIDLNLRGFWNKHLRMWRFLCEQRGVKQLVDVKRQFVLDYLDSRLEAGLAATGVNNELRIFHTFLLFLQEEGYAVPNSLLRIPGFKLPDRLPKYLTDEQIKKLREEVEREVRDAPLASKRRLALLTRAVFYLLWQGGLRIGEVEELRLEDLDLPAKRLSVRDGKGRKDRTVYVTETIIHALQAYLSVRGTGNSDHVFLYRNAPLKKDLIRARIKEAGARAGVKVYPHRLRHTCATQLLNAGCRVTSIQRFLGHKDLGTTMIYARVHDQTVADDYFAAMQRVEERLQFTQEPNHEDDEDVSVQERTQLFHLIKQLESPDLCLEKRLSITGQLRDKLLMSPRVILSMPKLVELKGSGLPRRIL
jgi:site-specific recombinase XerD